MNSDVIKKTKELLISRKFWSGVAGILALYFGYDLTPELQASLIVLITGAYTLSTGLQSGLDKYNNGDINIGTKIKDLLVSRKFWAAIASLALTLNIELPPEWAASMIAVITALYGLGTAVETGARAR